MANSKPHTTKIALTIDWNTQIIVDPADVPTLIEILSRAEKLTTHYSTEASEHIEIIKQLEDIAFKVLPKGKYEVAKLAAASIED